MFQNAPFDEKSVATVEELDTQTKLTQNVRSVQNSVYKQQRHYVCNHANHATQRKYERNNAICGSVMISSVIWIKPCSRVLRVVKLQARDPLGNKLKPVRWVFNTPPECIRRAA